MAQENPEKIEIEQSDEIKDKKFKKPSLKVILISIIGFLVVLLIIGISLILFTSKNHKEEVAQEHTPVAQDIAHKPEVIEDKEPEVKIDLSSINSQKLNEQLANLTNKNLKKENQNPIANEESRRVLEEQKRIEEESLKIEEDMVSKQKSSLVEKKAELEMEMQKLEALKKEAQIAKEELLKAQNINNSEPINQTDDLKLENKEKTKRNNKEETKKEIETEVKKQNNSEFLQLINVAKIKGVLHKKYLDKATKINPDIHLCRDELNKIELYYGPFENNEERESLLNKLLKNGFSQAYELEMTNEEFNKRCKY